MKHLDITSFLRLLRIEMGSGQSIEIEEKDERQYHYPLLIKIGVCPEIKFKPSKNEVYVMADTTKFWTASSIKGDDPRKMGMNKRNISWWHARQLVAMAKELVVKRAMGVHADINNQLRTEMWTKNNAAIEREMVKHSIVSNPLETKEKLLKVADSINKMVKPVAITENSSDTGNVTMKRPVRSMGSGKTGI